ncbi:response regulator [Variovorax sp. CCNWLW225]|uniref:phosphorylase family protein n=1 Tax=Variovorax sp. CCNWLW225 TaxID=3127462 RepID=UPI0030774454
MTKVLIVDDNPNKYSALVQLVGRPSLTADDVSVASNIRDALVLLQKLQFDVLVLDMFLPEVPWSEPIADGGSRLLDHLEEDDELKTPKYIIGITASGQEDDLASVAFQDKPWVLLRTTGGVAWERRLVAMITHAIDSEAAQDALGFGVDVCLITALKTPEFEALTRTGVVFDDPTLMDSSTYIQKGTLKSGERTLALVAGTCLRMGSTEAALLAAKLIERYRPKIVAMAGICAGYEDKVGYGDVIVASPCWDYSMSSKITVVPDGTRTVTHAPDYIEVASEISSRFDQMSGDDSFLSAIHANWPGDKPRARPQIFVGPSATGPAVIADAGVFSDIRKQQHRNTIGLEMEAYGIYSAVRKSSRPRPLFFSAKAVCDYASFLKDDKYQKYASYTSASVVVEFLTRYGADLCQTISE